MIYHRMTMAAAAVLLLAACDPVVTSQARGEARKAMFRECMELAAKMPRQSDDDVAGVVGECSAQSHYMTNYVP